MQPNTNRPRWPDGWYADPWAPEQLRYFDGRDWTEYTMGAPRRPAAGAWAPA